MHPRVIHTLARARGAGATLDIERDFDAIANLEAIASESEHAGLDDRLALLEMPIMVGNMALYRLSPGAVEWYCEKACIWFPPDSAALEMSLPYAQAHSHAPEVLLRLANRFRASAAIWAWSLRVRCARETLLAAANSLLPAAPPSTVHCSPSTVHSSLGSGILVAPLVARASGTLQYWIWEVSSEAAAFVLREVRSAEAMAQGLSPIPDANAARSGIRYLQAERAFLKRIADRKSEIENQKSKIQP